MSCSTGRNRRLLLLSCEVGLEASFNLGWSGLQGLGKPGGVQTLPLLGAKARGLGGNRFVKIAQCWQEFVETGPMPGHEHPGVIARRAKVAVPIAVHHDWICRANDAALPATRGWLIRTWNGPVGSRHARTRGNCHQIDVMRRTRDHPINLHLLAGR